MAGFFSSHGFAARQGPMRFDVLACWRGTLCTQRLQQKKKAADEPLIGLATTLV